MCILHVTRTIFGHSRVCNGERSLSCESDYGAPSRPHLKPTSASEHCVAASGSGWLLRQSPPATRSDRRCSMRRFCTRYAGLRPSYRSAPFCRPLSDHLPIRRISKSIHFVKLAQVPKLKNRGTLWWRRINATSPDIGIIVSQGLYFTCFDLWVLNVILISMGQKVHRKHAVVIPDRKR